MRLMIVITMFCQSRYVRMFDGVSLKCILTRHTDYQENKNLALHFENVADPWYKPWTKFLYDCLLYCWIWSFSCPVHILSSLQLPMRLALDVGQARPNRKKSCSHDLDIGLFFLIARAWSLLLVAFRAGSNRLRTRAWELYWAFCAGITTMITRGGHFLKIRFLPQTSKIRAGRLIEFKSKSDFFYNRMM